MIEGFLSIIWQCVSVYHILMEYQTQCQHVVMVIINSIDVIEDGCLVRVSPPPPNCQNVRRDKAVAETAVGNRAVAYAEERLRS